MGKVAGPYDKFRNQKPADIPQDKWDAGLDAMNASVSGLKDPLGIGNAVAASSTPEQVANQIRTGTNKATTPQSSARAGAVKQIGGVVSDANAEDKRLVGNLEGTINTSNLTDNNALNALSGEQQRASAGYHDVANRQRQLAGDYNNLSAQLFGGYAQGQAGLNAQDQATNDRYMAETNPLMQQLTARGSDPADVARQQSAYNLASGISGGSLDYSAAQYQSNPGDVARQTQSYNQLNGVGQGSLDYTADNWQSNPADVARQTQGYEDMRAIGGGLLDYSAQQWRTNKQDLKNQYDSLVDYGNIAGGSLSYDSRAGLAEADPMDLQNQRKALADIQNDLANGGKDQREVMEKYKALSDPSVTGKERFLSELARREFETGDKSSRDAVSSNLAARGLRSGGQQIAMQQSAQQQLSQDRLLKELGIQAQAVDRSMTALGGWGNSANALRSGDQNALNMQSGLSTALRNASFDEAYKRGLGMDAASANNQSTRLAGSQLKGNQANVIRGQNDQVGMFNANQSNVASANNQGVQLAGYQGATAQSNAIRNSNDAVGTFNVGQNNVAKANNQSTRLGGMQSAAQQSNAIRSANDMVGTFNVGQVNTAQANNQSTRMSGAQLTALQSNAIRSSNDSQRQYEDTYTQNEATRVGNLAGQRAGEGRATTAAQSQRQDNVFRGGQDVLDTNYGRDSDPLKTDWEVVGKDYGMGKDTFDAVTGNAANKVGRAGTLATVGSNINASGSDRLIRSIGLNTNQWGNLEEKSLADSPF